ncbi:MAG: UDP-N-acetylmuramate:L-alanyl-gamma-D-glutamyl-meso-diaminopimelate ligase [Acidobacteriota bacterium]
MIRRIHFIGICGTGMASLAAMLKERGYEVSGSDEGVYPPMSDFLAERQIPVHPGFDFAHLRPEPDLVVIGNTLSRGNPEIEYVLNFRIPYTSFPAAVRDFFLRDRTCTVVAGTHGKTTTTAMIAWGLHVGGRRPDFLIGGIAANFGSSYGLEGGKHFLIEGDEYDSAFFDKGPKFLHYMPHVAVVGNVEFDHADIYPDLAAVKVQFRRLVNLIPQRGFLAVGAECPAALEVSRRALCRVESFGLDPSCDWSAREVRIDGKGTSFEALYRAKLFRRIRTGLAGAFNVRNALAAICVLHHLGVPEDDIREAMESFRGVRRRLQILAEAGGIRIWEDFAHHPTAVRETLKGVREAFHPARLWAIYEPRSATSRRGVFQQEITEALAVADCIALPPLFKPEKIAAEERLCLDSLVRALQAAGRLAWNLPGVDAIIQKVCDEGRPGDMVVIMSNGGFGGIHQKLPAALRRKMELLERGE